MDSTFVWIMMFSGAAIALLAVFLVASEKELKKKRLEIDQLLVRLGDNPATEGMSVSDGVTAGYNSQELEQLRARNEELEHELAAVSSKLESGASVSEELDLAQRNVDIAKSNAQWLQTSNDELKAQVEELKSRLAASEARAVNSAGPVAATNRQQALEREIIELREQLVEGHTQAGDVGGMQQRIANLEANESDYRAEKTRLEAKISELEKELLAFSATKADEVTSVREQLAEADRMQKLLRDEQSGLEQEVARLNARVKEAEEQSRQISALQEPFQKLLAKQSALQERQREYHDAMASFSQLLAKSNNSSSRPAGFNEFSAEAPSGGSGSAPGRNGIYEETDTANISASHVIAAAETAQKPKRRFGLFPLVIALAFGGTLLTLWAIQSSDDTTTANALPVAKQEKPTAKEATAPAPASAQQAEPVPNEALAAPEKPTVKEAAAPAVKEKAQPARSVEVAKVQQPVTGTYEITQSSRVYAAPSELSQQMGDIEPGVRVNVVNAKNGWLEIHSKHGRPPGFIRKDSARLLAQN
jgi:hypothetical protein